MFISESFLINYYCCWYFIIQTSKTPFCFLLFIKLFFFDNFLVETSLIPVCKVLWKIVLSTALSIKDTDARFIQIPFFSYCMLKPTIFPNTIIYSVKEKRQNICQCQINAGQWLVSEIPLKVSGIILFCHSGFYCFLIITSLFFFPCQEGRWEVDVGMNISSQSGTTQRFTPLHLLTFCSQLLT